MDPASNNNNASTPPPTRGPTNPRVRPSLPRSAQRRAVSPAGAYPFGNLAMRSPSGYGSLVYRQPPVTDPQSRRRAIGGIPVSSFVPTPLVRQSATPNTRRRAGPEPGGRPPFQAGIGPAFLPQRDIHTEISELKLSMERGTETIKRRDRTENEGHGVREPGRFAEAAEGRRRVP